MASFKTLILNDKCTVKISGATILSLVFDVLFCLRYLHFLASTEIYLAHIHIHMFKRHVKRIQNECLRRTKHVKKTNNQYYTCLPKTKYHILLIVSRETKY